MKILVTGANGFIGRNIVEKLKHKYLLLFPGREGLNLLDEKAVRAYLQYHRFDIVIHAANVNNTRNAFITDYDSLDGNLRMFFNLVQCRGYYGKMYYFGSGAEYGMEHYVPFMKEKYFGTYVPKDSYGFSKYIMSEVSGWDNNIYDLRLFGVYGKYEEWERRFISNAICRALTGSDITIKKNVYFDYLWIDDLCDIMQWFIENEPKYKTYNVCRGRKIDLYSLAEIVREKLNADCDIQVKEPGWKPEYTGSNERLLEEMGDYAFTGFGESISSLCAYYKSNIDLIDREKLDCLQGEK